MIAAEQHALRLVLPASQQSQPIRWSSHRDLAAKALRKLAGPHLPATLTQLEKAVKQAHSAYAKAERAHHEAQWAAHERAAKRSEQNDEQAGVDPVDDDA